MISTAFNAANVSIDHHSYAMLEIMHETLHVKRKAEAALEDVRKLLGFAPTSPPLPERPGLQTYLVEVNFDRIKYPKKRQKFLSIPTTLGLEPGQVADLVNIGGELLEQNEWFRRFLRDVQKTGRDLRKAKKPGTILSGSPKTSS